MTSKEALERLKEETQPNAYTLNHNDEDFAIISQDLDRLEKLEKFVDIYKYTNQRFIMMVQAPYSDLPSPTMEQELLRVEVLENEYKNSNND